MRSFIALWSVFVIAIAMGCQKNDSGAKTPAETEASEGGAAEQATAKADNYLYAELINAIGDAQLLQAYKTCEDQLREDPQDPVQRMQKSFLLLNAGHMMPETNTEQARKAFRAASDNAKQLVKDQPELPEPFHEVLSEVFYSGAAAEAAAGDAEAAKATLQQAIHWGWSDIDQLQGDPDLASVRALPNFEADLTAWIEARRQIVLERARAELAAGESFPFDFSVTDIEGSEIKLADLKGKVVIVDIWGTWCPPCREEVPSFIKLQEAYGDKGLQIVGLNYEQAPDDATALEMVKDYVEGNGVNYPCALGSEEIRAQVPDFRGFPTTILIDREGKVRLKLEGLHGYLFLEAIVETLLSDEAPTGDQSPPADGGDEAAAKSS